MKEYCLPIKVFDFFSGCGGASKGFQQAGMDIVFALDNDPDAEKTFKHNFPETFFQRRDIREFHVEELQLWIESCKDHPVLFSGCAPCQPFTKQHTNAGGQTDDPRISLLDEFCRFVEYYRPEFVFVENVPGLRKFSDKRGSPIERLSNILERLGYETKKDYYRVIYSQDYGVPQKRSRLVLIASRLGKLPFPPKAHGSGTNHPEYATVREWIGDPQILPPLKVGETHPSVPNHRAANLSPLNLKRIQRDRSSWTEDLKPNCYTNGYNGHTDVYRRMVWDQPATGLTTRCISFSNGRFGHPEQDRAISVREAACLQTFPMDFIFYGNLASMARQIGNAVPVLLAKRFGENFIKHVQAYLEGTQ